MGRTRQAMVLLASEQLWPNIHGLVHWHRNAGGLTDVCIYHTDDEERSRQPALRLKAFCERFFDKPVRIHFPSQKKSPITPQAVRDQIRQWQDELPNRRWIINATGGLKLMFAGVLECCHLPRTEVYYRELSGEWFQIRASTEGFEAERVEIPTEETDDIPIELLLSAVSKIPENAEFQLSKEAAHLPIVRLIQCGAMNGWDWKDAFRKCELPYQEQSGILFERFVAGVLRELGIHNIATTVKLICDEQVRQEVDVVANYLGRLLVIDCKLRTEQEEGERVESITSQIRQASTVRTQLGGLGCRLLLLRPNRRLSPDTRDFCRSLSLEVLDANDAHNFFNEIAKFCGYYHPLPPLLHAAQELLNDLYRRGERDFFAISDWVCQSDPNTSYRVVIPVSSNLDRRMQELNQDWIAYSMDNTIWIQGVCPKSYDVVSIAQAFTSIFDGVGVVRTRTIQMCKSEGSERRKFRFPVTVTDAEAGWRRRLEERLSQYIGRKIFDIV